MSGAVKHMERSHRSHRKTQQYGIFASFHRRAYTVQNMKNNRKNAIQKLSDLIKKALPKTTSK